MRKYIIAECIKHLVLKSNYWTSNSGLPNYVENEIQLNTLLLYKARLLYRDLGIDLQEAMRSGSISQVEIDNLLGIYLFLPRDIQVLRCISFPDYGAAQRLDESHGSRLGSRIRKFYEDTDKKYERSNNDYYLYFLYKLLNVESPIEAYLCV